MANPVDVRPSPIAGTWYPGDPDRLRQEVDSYMSQATLPQLDGEILAVIAPHAGHRYSGRTAGYAFASLRGQTRDLVTVISPMHGYFPASILTTAHTAYATPLGTVPVDQDAVAELDHIFRQESRTHLTAIANDGEHSLEIELPFLQRSLEGAFKLLPLMIRSQDPAVAYELGQALAKALRSRNALMVASTDLSHFYPEEEANELDAEMLRQIGSFSPEAVIATEQAGRGFACGVMPVATVLWAARELGGNVVTVLHHSTSADETGDHSSVVGYGAAVVLRRG
jgi:AmmeMemoRadiSam system protein B